MKKICYENRRGEAQTAQRTINSFQESIQVKYVSRGLLATSKATEIVITQFSSPPGTNHPTEWEDAVHGSVDEHTAVVPESTRVLQTIILTGDVFKLLPGTLFILGPSLIVTVIIDKYIGL